MPVSFQESLTGSITLVYGQKEDRLGREISNIIEQVLVLHLLVSITRTSMKSKYNSLFVKLTLQGKIAGTGEDTSANDNSATSENYTGYWGLGALTLH